MRRSRLIGIILLLVLLASAAWYAGSPWRTLRQMQTAARAHDSDALAGYVDFPALRQNVKSGISTRMAAEAKDRSGMGALGMAFGMAIADRVIDAMVSPAGIRLMFASAGDGGKAPSPIRADDNRRIEIERIGLSEFKVREKGQPDRGAMIFHRDGLSWKLAGIDLPDRAPAGSP